MPDRPKVGPADAATRRRMMEEQRLSAIAESKQGLYKAKPAPAAEPVSSRKAITHGGKTYDEIVEEAERGRRRDNQSTDSNN